MQIVFERDMGSSFANPRSGSFADYSSDGTVYKSNEEQIKASEQVSPHSNDLPERLEECILETKTGDDGLYDELLKKI